jgi:hypothetical protein
VETLRGNFVATQEVDSEEIAVIEGMKQAKQICQKIGMQLDQIISVR